jgi:ABC-type multidrug transport system fused ATPase/permease subunit
MNSCLFKFFIENRKFYLGKFILTFFLDFIFNLSLLSIAVFYFYLSSESKDVSLYQRLIILWLIIAIVSSFSYYFSTIKKIELKCTFANIFKSSVLNNFIKVNMQEFEQVGKGKYYELLILTDQISVYAVNLAEVLSQIFSILILCVFVLFSMGFYSLILIIICFLIILFLNKIFKLIIPIQEKKNIESSIQKNFLEESIQNFEIIRQEMSESYFSKKYTSILNKVSNLDKKLSNASLTLQKFIKLIVNIMTIALPILIYLLAIHFKNVQNKNSSILILALFVFGLAQNLLFGLIASVQSIVSANAKSKIIQNVFKQFASSPLIIDKKYKDNNLTEYSGILKEFSINNLTFKYGTNAIFNDVSIKFPNTGLIALTGESGIGKSTFIKIISGLYKPDSGIIEFNDKKMTTKNLQNIVSYAPDIPIFLPKSVKYNIKSGSIKQNNSSKEYKSADKIIQNNKEIFSQDILVNSGGLSGGQKQIVNILRAVQKNAPILILDEPIFSQNAKNANLIFDLLKEISIKKLVIVSIHEFSKHEFADKIDYIIDFNKQGNLNLNKRMQSA